MKKTSYFYLAVFALVASKLMAQMGATATTSFSTQELTALYETESVPSTEDAADDMCIWVSDANAEQSIIVGTDKTYGLMTYNLKGALLHRYPFGRMNNVDLFYFNQKPLVCASNRSNNCISIFELNAKGELKLLFEQPTLLRDVYGICAAKFRGDTYLFISDKKGKIQQWKLSSQNQTFHLEKVRTIKVKSVVEGMVANNEKERLYFAQEDVGVWFTSLSPKSDAKNLIYKTQANLKADFEGIALLNGKQYKKNYLFVSAQGSNKYFVLDEDTFELKRVFSVVDGPTVDGTSETDGLDVSALQSADFPEGILVVQDGMDDQGTQNFKLISLAQLQLE